MKTATSTVYTNKLLTINILTKFHKDWMKTATSIVYTSDLINILTKFHKDWMKTVYTNKMLTDTRTHTRTYGRRTSHGHISSPVINVASRAIIAPSCRTDGRMDGQRQNNIPPPMAGDNKLKIDDIHYMIKEASSHETNVLSKFHENWATNVTSTLFTCFHYIHIGLKCPAHWRPYINKTNVLTNFHDDLAKNVTSRVFTRENCHYIHIEKNAPPTGGNVFSPILTIFELVRDIKKSAPPTGGHVFQRIGTTFELNQDIIKTNILTNFELDFIGTKLLTKFHEDGTRSVA
ncbi:hypothetical protein DPMN_101416 [Dreissena polymorpha]|uniref:Uncharacterized protein n=1 Tax=Dreissena polymorpha TaxID=45954 RepID=A0A9D4LIX2_DREPO|nr:hypothetical protein DPMN_101416 [Dreissena polymorpha]